MKRFNQSFLVAILLVFFVTTLTGCWSSRPIEDLNLIIGSAIDKEKDNKIKSTLQYVIPNALDSNSSGGGTTMQKPYINISATGDSLEPAGWETTLNREGVIFGAHQKVVIIGEDLAREFKLRELTDLYYRDLDIRGSTHIFISKGRADQVLETKELSKIPSIRIVEIATMALTSRILQDTTLMKIWGKLNSKTSFLIQMLESKNGEVSFNGAAIIKGGTTSMIGTLTKEEVEGINWITGQGKGGTVKAYDNPSDKPTYYQIESMKSKIKPHVKGDQISFDVSIKSEGRIAEYWNPKGQDAFINKNVKRIEKEAENQVKKIVKNVLEKTQKEYKVDVVGFGNKFRIEYPKDWKKLQENWDETFSKSKITYHVDFTIKDYGMIGAKKKK